MTGKKNYSIGYMNGTIPAPTFIENLVDGVAGLQREIFLYGSLKNRKNYPAHVHVRTYSNRSLTYFAEVAWNILLLMMKQPGKVLQAARYFKKKPLKKSVREFALVVQILLDNPDILHIQWAKSVNIFPSIFQLYPGKIVLSLRGAHINYSPLLDEGLRKAYIEYFKQIHAFHAVSGAIAAEAEKYGALPERTAIIYTCINDHLLENKIPMNGANKPLRLLSVGRFHWKKGYSYAIDAVRILHQQGIPVKYTIVAQGNIPDEILFHIHQAGLKDAVEIINGLPHPQVMELMQHCDLFLLPSVEEGIANVVLEAMAVGLPVITTDCGGMAEAVQEGVNGFIVPVRDPQSIASAVVKFAGMDQEMKQKLVQNARETVRDKFLLSRQIKKFDEFYIRLLDR